MKTGQFSDYNLRSEQYRRLCLFVKRICGKMEFLINPPLCSPGSITTALSPERCTMHCIMHSDKSLGQQNTLLPNRTALMQPTAEFGKNKQKQTNLTRLPQFATTHRRQGKWEVLSVWVGSCSVAHLSCSHNQALLSELHSPGTFSMIMCQPVYQPANTSCVGTNGMSKIIPSSYIGTEDKRCLGTWLMIFK